MPGLSASLSSVVPEITQIMEPLGAGIQRTVSHMIIYHFVILPFKPIYICTFSLKNLHITQQKEYSNKFDNFAR